MTKHVVEAEELQAYLDGELEPGRQAEVERHLGDCAECAALLGDLKRVSATLRRWQVEPAPADLNPPAVEAVKPAQRWTWRRLALAFAGTAAVVLLVFAIRVPDLLRWRQPVAPPTATVPSEEEPPVAWETRGFGTAQQEEEKDRGAGSQGAAAPAKQPASAPSEKTRRKSYKEPELLASRHAPERIQEQGQLARAVASTAPDRLAPSLAARGKEAEGVAVAKQVQPEAQPQAQKEAATAGEFEGREEAAGGVFGGRVVGERQSAPLKAGERAPLRSQFRAKRAVVPRRIAYQVTMTIEVKEFAAAKEKLENVVEEAGGYVAQARATATPKQPQRAELVVRVPTEKLSAVLEQVRGLGRVTHEQLSTEELTEQLIDLEARLRNARAAEQRLITVLNERTGKVGDVLEVEREITRTREQIERMEAWQQNLLQRVELATVRVTLVEEFQAQLEPAPLGTGTRLRNAFVEGYESFVATLLGFGFFFARYGLVLLFWGGLLWLAWRSVGRPVRRLVSTRPE